MDGGGVQDWRGPTSHTARPCIHWRHCQHLQVMVIFYLELLECAAICVGSSAPLATVQHFSHLTLKHGATGCYCLVLQWGQLAPLCCPWSSKDYHHGRV